MTIMETASPQLDWRRAEQLLESGQEIEAVVTGVNRGGVVVQFGPLRGFVPNSHLTSIPRGLPREARRNAKSELVGQPLLLRVIETNRRRNRLVLSEREIDPNRRRRLWAELAPGQRRTGIVRSILDFGAFVDLGGIDGLLHISELDWKHTEHPSDLLEVGQEIEVYVLRVDKRKERVRLSRKRLTPDPWPIVARHLDDGQITQGTVSRATRTGLLVDLGQGVKGLLRFSELSDPERARADLAPGSPVWVRANNVDPKRRRISLSLHEDQPGSRPPLLRSLWLKLVKLVSS
jgi:small subunit ribosomal protein S1